MLTFIAYFTACAILVHGQGDIIEFDNKTECINQMVEWCDGMQYPQQGIGLALMSVTFEDPKGYYRVFCSSDSDGTNCTRNGMPWFACSPQQVVTYKGRVLTNTSTDVDNDICETANTAFNDLFVQNLSYDNTTMKNEVTRDLEAFFEQMAAMEEQIELIQKLLRTIPAINSLWSEFDDRFLFENLDSTTSSKELIQSSDLRTIATGSSVRSDSASNIADSTTTTPSSSTSSDINNSEESDSATIVSDSSASSYSATTVPDSSASSDSATFVPDSSASSTTAVPGSSDSTTVGSDSFKGSDSTTVGSDSFKGSDSTTVGSDSFKGSDSTTTAPVDDQKSNQ